MEQDNEQKSDKAEPIDFASKIIKPHQKISRVVDEGDLSRVMEDAKILYNLCYTQVGVHPGGYAVTHPQIDSQDPLRFFVTRDKEIIMNPVIMRHTEHTVDSKEGCLSFGEYLPITVQRWNKITVIYERLYPDGKIEKCKENVSGIRAKVFQHENQHLDGLYIYDKNL